MVRSSVTTVLNNSTRISSAVAIPPLGTREIDANQPLRCDGEFNSRALRVIGELVRHERSGGGPCPGEHSPMVVCRSARHVLLIPSAVPILSRYSIVRRHAPTRR